MTTTPEINIDKEMEAIRTIIADLPADAISDIIAGLIGTVRIRAESEKGIDHAIDLLDSLSSFTTKIHIETRQRKATLIAKDTPNEPVPKA